MLRDADASWNEETMRYTVDWEGPDGSLRSLEISEDNEIPPKVLHVNLVQIGIENPLKAHGQVLDYIYDDGPSKPAFGEEEGVSDEPRASDGTCVKVSGTREFVDEQIGNFQKIRTSTFEPLVVEEEEPEPEPELEPESEPEPETEEIPPEDPVSDTGEIPGEGGLF